MTRAGARGPGGRRRADRVEPDGTDDTVDRDDEADGVDGADGVSAPARGGRRGSRLDALYRGNGKFDIVGRAKTWYAVFGVVVLICVLSIVIRGFNFGIDFEGGTSVQFPANGPTGAVSTGEVARVYSETLGFPATSVQTAGQGSTSTVIIRSERLDEGRVVALRQALFDRFQPVGSTGAPDPRSVSDSAVSASWGGEITRQALIALAVFLVLVAVYLAFYFERRMAFAALVALANDIIITAGVYSLVGFEVSPATVIGLLTILGFSLYDTVVVFDKVRENTRGLLGLTRRTYAEAANLAVNQTLMRSLNTSLIAALPLMGLFVVGVVFLGVGVLGDLALVQLVGTLIGAASSVLLATPVVVDLAMRDRKWAEQARKVANRRAKDATRRGGAVAPSDVAPAGGGRGRRGPGPGDGPVDGDTTDALDTRAVVAGAAKRPGGRGGGARADRATGPDDRGDGRAPRPGARPSGKANRPTGKRRK